MLVRGDKAIAGKRSDNDNLKMTGLRLHKKAGLLRKHLVPKLPSRASEFWPRLRIETNRPAFTTKVWAKASSAAPALIPPHI